MSVWPKWDLSSYEAARAHLVLSPQRRPRTGLVLAAALGGAVGGAAHTSKSSQWVTAL